MTSRSLVLQRIRVNLGPSTSPELPPVPPVWPTTNPTSEELRSRFVEELRSVHGEPVTASNWGEAAAILREIAQASGWNQVLVMDRPLVRDLVSKTDLPWETTLLAENPPARDLAGISVAVIQADYLLADTGSSVVVCERPGERLACYLPPACIVVAETSQLREHLPALWNELATKAAEPDRRGEFVIITGPSRTADIEKILILGVHGPKRLIVLIVG